MEWNVWFYTFSTAAQVAAASVGLFAVFVVYKIQDFAEPLKKTRREVAGMIPYISQNMQGHTGYSQDQVRELNDVELLSIFRELLDAHSNQPSSVMDPTFTEGDYKHFCRLVNLRVDILKDLREVMLLGFGVIGIALFALVGTQFILPNIYLTYFILCLFLGLFIFFLFAIRQGTYRIATKDGN